jgi:hypothetical protein
MCRTLILFCRTRFMVNVVPLNRFRNFVVESGNVFGGEVFLFVCHVQDFLLPFCARLVLAKFHEESETNVQNSKMTLQNALNF